MTQQPSATSAPAPDEPAGLVCHCRRVPYATVERTLQDGRARSLADIQRETTACTRCFGCRFELQRMLEEELGSEYVPTEFAELVADRPSLMGRIVSRLRGGTDVLPRRMYMPVLHGFAGRAVDTRVVFFNCHESGDGEARPVSARTDLLALDGTRVAVWNTSVPLGGSGVLTIGELPEAATLPDGVGVVKLVIDAEALGSLRPYFQIMSPAGITSTHEKAGPASPATFERSRPYHWLFPVGRGDFAEEAWMFCTNTQSRPTGATELVFADEHGSERAVPFPDLELDQSAWIPLHQLFPEVASGRTAGSVRIQPSSHKLAGFIVRYDQRTDLWRVQHL